MSLASTSTDLNEAVRLGAVDGIYFAHRWFPKTFRQRSPEIHRHVWDAMDDPINDFVGLEIFRGSGKTTIMRTHLAKRISYAVSRTMLLIGPNQGHAVRSVRWLKGQLKRNSEWTQAFGLRLGSKTADDEIEIINEVEECSIYCLGMGITGATRGLNLDDWRPDFIGVDDPCDEENTATPDQREKMEALFFGSLQQGLAPKSEAPHRKMGLFQTGLHKKDLINLCHTDKRWKTLKIGVFDEVGQSVWPVRFPTEELLAAKQGFIERGQIHYWLREMECKIIAAETAAFNTSLLKYYKHLPDQLTVFIGIDPARETQLRTKAHKAAIVAVGIADGIAYLLDYWAEANQNPEAIWQAYFKIATKWRPLITVVESTAYQQTLAWYMRQRMTQMNTYFTVKEVTDRRRKPDRIRQAFTERINMGTFQVNESQSDFIQALAEYTDNVDIDVLDAGAFALDAASPHLRAQTMGTTTTKELARERWGEYEDYGPEDEFVGACP